MPANSRTPAPAPSTAAPPADLPALAPAASRAGLPPAAPAPAPRPLPVSDQRVLSALGADGTVSFQGLRRLLGLHPQVLSRILKRLKLAGLVADAEGGYRLDPAGMTRPASALGPGTSRHAARGARLDGRDDASQGGVNTDDAARPSPLPNLASVDGLTLPTIAPQHSAVLLHMALQSPDTATVLVAALTGRWFRTLRWLGKARMGETTVLAWLVEPEGLVLRLVLEGSELRIEVAPEARELEPVHEGLRALLPAIGLALAPVRPLGPAGRLAARAPLLLAN